MSGLELRYHVPRSQVWAGSRGRQAGNVHLHVLEPLERGRLRRSSGRPLCGRDGWYERPLEGYERERLPEGLCPRCAELADRYELPCDCGAAVFEIHDFACWRYPAHAPRWPGLVGVDDA